MVQLSQRGDRIIVRRSSVFAERLEQLGAKIDNQSTDNRVKMTKLINRRGGFYYNIDYLLATQAKEESGLGKIRILPNSFETQSAYIVVSNNLPASVDKRIRAAMAELRQTGELRQILAKYGSAPANSP